MLLPWPQPQCPWPCSRRSPRACAAPFTVRYLVLLHTRRTPWPTARHSQSLYRSPYLDEPISMMQGQPVIILKEGTERTRGKGAHSNNIAAAKAVAEEVRSSLGPKGRDKMLVGSMA